MPRITLRNHKVHFQQMGSGPDIVLIHGLSCHIAFWWFHVAPHLSKTHRVTAVDLRGHGFTGMTESGYRPCDLAADVEALLAHLGVAKARILGHSFGGAVASALTTLQPDCVSELILADAWLPSLQPVPPLLSERDWTTTLSRARARGVAVEPNLPLVVRGLFKEMLDEQEYQSEEIFEEATPTPPATSDPADAAADEEARDWEDGNWSPKRSRLHRLRRGGSRLGRSLWSPLKSRADWLGRIAAMQSSEPEPEAPTKPAADAAAGALKGAMLMTGAPGEASLALRRWQELMRRTNARAEYLDTTAIDADDLGGIEVPVRLVYGASSRYRPSALKLKKLLPDARLRIVPRAGHYFPLLRPQGLLDSLGPPPPPAAENDQAPGLRLVRPAPAEGSEHCSEQSGKSGEFKPGMLQA